MTFAYDPTTGRLTDTNLPNGTKIHQDYDAAGRILNLTNTVTASGAAIANYTNAQYSVKGQLTGVAAPDGQYAYTYDTLGRLETWTDPTGALHRYRFDLDTNRTEQDLNGTATHTYQYESDASDKVMNVDNGAAYSYDSAGDVQARPGQTLAWDPFGRVSKVTNTSDNSYVQYVYDSLDRVRERKQYNAAQTLISDVLYSFDGTGDQPSWEKETAGPNAGTMKSYLDSVAVEYAGNRSTGIPTYLYSDIHGNTVATADANGNRTAGPFTYDPFGASTTPTGNGTNPTSFGFVGKFGKYTDAAAGGLVLMGARPYDPALGRFLAVDPVEGGSANDYDYANQDPVDDFDLTGTMDMAASETMFEDLMAYTLAPVARAGISGVAKVIGFGASIAVGIGGIFGGLWHFATKTREEAEANPHSQKRPSMKGVHQKGMARKVQKYTDVKRKSPTWKPFNSQ